MKQQYPFSRDLVLIGGGHTHALVLRMWAMKPLPGVRLTLINPGPTAPYSGMLPGFVAGHYTRDDLDIDLIRLARFANARVVLGAVSAIEPDAKLITVPGRPEIAYDSVSVDVGITSAMPMLPGFADHAVPAKPLGPFASKWQAFRATASDPQIAVIGGGVAGAELAMAMAHALRRDGQTAVVQLIDRGEILKGLLPATRAKMRIALQSGGVTLIENTAIRAVTADGVTTQDGTLIASQFTTGAAGAKPHAWIREIGVDLHEGFIAVNEALQSSDPALFAVGDCAHLSANPRPKAGVYAVRQAPVLFDNLRAVLSGESVRNYVPQKDYLKLISLGGKAALAERFGMTPSGALMWHLKDHIDRKFMSQFSDLPTQEQPALPGTAAEGLAQVMGQKPLCGGCAAKVGRGALTAALDGLPRSQRKDVALLPGDDAAVLNTGGVQQVLTTDHLRALTDDPVTMARIAATHALGDIWAMGAAPQAATVNLILPRMADVLHRRTLSEIMIAAQDVLTQAGAAIAGGHTSVGEELTIGFSITGLLDADRSGAGPITLAGGQAGDVLILTKPLGSGVIMAAEMQGRAPGADVAQALDHMMQSQAQAAILLRHAHAMTDVTGFGLAGHLAGLCRASGVAAVLDRDAIPLMQGALSLSKAGVQASSYPQNLADAGRVVGADGPLGALLFDPQTAGGLLAAVEQSSATPTLLALQAAGYPAAIIGALVEGAGPLRVQA